MNLFAILFKTIHKRRCCPEQINVQTYLTSTVIKINSSISKTMNLALKGNLINTSQFIACLSWNKNVFGNIKIIHRN